MKGGPASLRMFHGRPVSGKVRGYFPSETGCFPSFHALWPLCLYKTPGASLLALGNAQGASLSQGLAGVDHPSTAGLFLYGCRGKLLLAYVIKRLEL